MFSFNNYSAAIERMTVTFVLQRRLADKKALKSKNRFEKKNIHITFFAHSFSVTSCNEPMDVEAWIGEFLYVPKFYPLKNMDIDELMKTQIDNSIRKKFFHVKGIYMCN